MSINTELYYLLKSEKIDEFNKKVDGLRDYNLSRCNLRGRNLQNANLKYANLEGAYLSHCNLKGVNLSKAKLEGASIHLAKISGVYFPKNITALEIANSISHGTRIRTKDPDTYEPEDETLIS